MIKIYSHNVRVWTRDRDKTSDWYWRKRMERIRALIKEESPDVLCLQELSFPANRYIPKNYRRVGRSISHPIYVKRGMQVRKHRFHLRWDSCEIRKSDDDPWMLIVNVHLHWNLKILKRNLRKINELLILWGYEQKYPVMVVCGDWNVGRETVEKYLTDVLSVVKFQHYTFKNSKTGTTGTIDHFATNHFGKTYRVYDNGQILSDHLPIIAID